MTDSPDGFRAIVIERGESGSHAAYTTLSRDALPPGDVEVRVHYSGINYKDALAMTGRGAVVRQFPMVPGIDLAGEVIQSSDARWKPGDAVVLTGWGIGETHWGGLSARARVQADWLLPLPEGLDPRAAMAFGTAGVTAALCVLALQRHGVEPGQGEVLVTGAAGGVGSVAVAILASLGFRVVASTGRMAEADHLRSLGAAEVMDRAALSDPGKPLQRERWAGVVDAVGSHTLANACASTRSSGAVAACGLAQGGDFPSTVMPFILRGISLYGINSVLVGREYRLAAWNLLKEHVTPERRDSLHRIVPFSEALGYADRVLAGQFRGHAVVEVDPPAR